jgi:hypothetical protein
MNVHWNREDTVVPAGKFNCFLTNITIAQALRQRLRLNAPPMVSLNVAYIQLLKYCKETIVVCSNQPVRRAAWHASVPVMMPAVPEALPETAPHSIVIPML